MDLVTDRHMPYSSETSAPAAVPAAAPAPTASASTPNHTPTAQQEGLPRQSRCPALYGRGRGQNHNSSLSFPDSSGPHRQQSSDVAFSSNRSTLQTPHESVHRAHAPWYLPTNHATQWSPNVGLPTQSHVQLSRPTGPDVPSPFGASSIAGSSAGAGAGAGISGPAPSLSTGPLQPGLPGPPQNGSSLHRDPFGSYSFAFRRPSTLQRFAGPGSATSNRNNQTGRQVGQQVGQQGPHMPERSVAPHISQHTPRAIYLPALHPPTNLTSLPAPRHFTHLNMSSPGESSRGTASDESRPRGHGSQTPDSFSRTAMSIGREPHHHHSNTHEPSFGSPNPQLLLATDRHRHHNPPRPRLSPYSARFALRTSDLDSDEDAEILEEEERALQLIEQYTVHGRVSQFHQDHIRASQLLRGQMSTTKRVASKSALAALESISIDRLEQNERTCVICYNDFGVENPEGINEAPLRLPKCQHVFGDHCIKKWFEESDSCPYCRDKVESTPLIAPNVRQIEELLRAVPRYASARLAAEASSAASTESYMRILSSRDESRADGSPPRVWNTGERRSPPAEASEHRRRTRARHGNFRASPPAYASSSRPSSYAGMPHPGPPQTARDRVNVPSLPHHWYPFGPYDPRRLLTPLFPRQISTGSHPPQPSPGRGSYSTVEPLALNPSSMYSDGTNLGQAPESYLGPLPPTHQVEQHGRLPGPVHRTAFAQLSPIGGMDATSFHAMESAANRQANSSGENWMQ